tara:strand:+ start:244 stop:660 length:417 start_codon:yes stop_codon:yes gene_type:complete
MSEVKTNKLTGTSTAGSILVTGEGNSTTTNLQQGLAKAWGSFEQSGTHTFRDSLNFSSISDLAVGRSSVVFTNNMADTNYATTGMSGEQAGGGNRVMGFCGSALTPASNTFAIANYNLSGGSGIDDDRLSICVLGDLA